MAQDDKRITAFSARIPNVLLQELAEIAQDEGRSVNQEIVQLVKRRIAERKATQPDRVAP